MTKLLNANSLECWAEGIVKVSLMCNTVMAYLSRV